MVVGCIFVYAFMTVRSPNIPFIIYIAIIITRQNANYPRISCF